LYGYTSLGRKIEWMRLNPLVCLECEELTSDRVWATVIVFGHYEELAHTPENADALRVADRLFQKHVMWWEPATVPLRGHDRSLPIKFRIHIDSVTGRRTISEQALQESDEPSLESRQPRWLAQMWRRLRPRRDALRAI
jgi:nitroimidazol reductase NimA-like FMN-containing flavoprotein (pyridoxamine 5'-phosphate oxidase superfamily)